MNSDLLENFSLQIINAPDVDFVFFSKILSLVHDIHLYHCFQYMDFSAVQTSLKLIGRNIKRCTQLCYQVTAWVRNNRISYLPN